MVTLETLRDAGVKVTPIALGRPKAIADCMRVSGLPSIEIKRQISPLLLELNAQGKVLNGHIPVTGVIAFILACGAVLYGYNRVAMSNERSANVGNIIRHDGFEVNRITSYNVCYTKLLRAGYVSPNPGGVGPMTRAMLLSNVVQAAERALTS